MPCGPTRQSSELRDPAVAHPLLLSQRSSALLPSPSGPQSLTPKPWGWGTVRVGLPSSIPLIVPQKSYLGSRSCPPSSRGPSPHCGQKDLRPTGRSWLLLPSHPSCLLSAEEAQVHVTGPRKQVDTPMPKDPGQGIWTCISAGLALSVPGLSRKLGGVKTPLSSPLLGLWLVEEFTPARCGYALQPLRQQE